MKNTIIQIQHENYTENVIVTEENKYQVAETFKGLDYKVVFQGDIEFKSYVRIDGSLIRPSEGNEVLTVDGKGENPYHLVPRNNQKVYQTGKGSYINYLGERRYIYSTC